MTIVTRVLSDPTVNLSCNTELENPIAAIRNGNYITALQQLMELAEQGNTSALLIAGLMYDEGEGIPRDYRTAYKLYMAAANKGDAFAQHLLGCLCSTVPGITVEDGKRQGLLWWCFRRWRKDYKAGYRWNRISAEQGNPYAQSSIGRMYYLGRHVPKNYQTAIKWFTRAGNNNNATAQYLLGRIYYDGDAIAVDYQLAAKWFRCAAEHGVANVQHIQGVPTAHFFSGVAKAQYFLGSMYFRGEGVPKDYCYAHMWLSLSINAGFAECQNLRDSLERLMKPAQLAKAKKLAMECRRNKYRDCCSLQV